MKAYRGQFKKRDGSIREMTFSRISDITKSNPNFIAAKIVGSGSTRQYPNGQELVWDLEVDDFRVFNWNKTISPVEEISVDDDIFG